MSYNTLLTIGYWLVAAFMLGGVLAIWWLTERVEKLQRENEELRVLLYEAEQNGTCNKGEHKSPVKGVSLAKYKAMVQG
jgi:hypothetical protein